MSPQVNLLDWRRDRRTRLQQRFRRQLQLAVLAALLLALAADLGLQFAGARQARRNGGLRTQVEALQRKLQAQTRLAEQSRAWQHDLEQIHGLQMQRVATIYWLEELTQRLPADVSWLQLDQIEGGLQLQGRAADATALAHYLQQLEASAWFSKVKLQSLRSEADGKATRFSLTLDAHIEPEAEPAS